MLLQPTPESNWDLNFRLMGFSVRVSWTFWLGAIVLGHSLVQGANQALLMVQGESPGTGPLLLVWVACVFVSILIHELGHALAFRRVGTHANIVLYHFGGLAIPVGSYGPSFSSQRLSEKEDLFVTAAGPFAQLLSAAVVIAGVRLAGYQLPNLPFGISDLPGLDGGKPLPSLSADIIVYMYLWPSIAWAFLNLVPVWPLDGGRIARSLFVLNGGTVVQSLWLSVIAAAVCAVWGFREQQVFLAIFFSLFAFESYQAIQQSGGWRY